MTNKLVKKRSNQKHVVTLFIILLPLLASCSLLSGSYEDGIKMMEKGEALLVEKKFDESIQAFTKAISIIENIDDRGNEGPGERIADCYKFRGTAYFKLNNYDKSLADFNKSIEMHNSGPGTAYAARGNLFLVKKDYEKAITDFEKVVPNVSDDYRAPLGMAIAFYETQKYEKAADFISIALEHLARSKDQPHYDPDEHIKAYEYSIKLSEQQGDTKNAESDRTSLEEFKKKHNKN